MTLQRIELQFPLLSERVHINCCNLQMHQSSSELALAFRYGENGAKRCSACEP